MMQNLDFCFNGTDKGPYPFVTNLRQTTLENDTYRTALWTGCHLQLTIMCIPCNGEIELENHCNLDQFLYIEAGNGLVCMGNCKHCLDYQAKICAGTGIFVPAGTWHTLKNTGHCPLKLFSVYAPPNHPHGTVEENPYK